MKVELKDEHFLGLSSVLTAAYGVHFYGWPGKAQEFYQPLEEPRSNVMARWFGLAMLQSTSAVMTACRADNAFKKDMLKTAGACWGAAAAQSAWNAQKKHEKKDVAWPSAALQAGVAGLLLWRGFKKDNKSA